MLYIAIQLFFHAIRYGAADYFATPDADDAFHAPLR